MNTVPKREKSEEVAIKKEETEKDIKIKKLNWFEFLLILSLIYPNKKDTQ